MSHPISPFIPAVFVPVSDLKSSTEWYAGLLERQIVPREHEDGIYIFDFDGTEVILDSNSWGSPPMLMFNTDNIEAAHRFCEGHRHETLTDVFTDEFISVFTVNANMVCQTHRADGSAKSQREHAKLRKISHIIVRSDNLHQSVDWYEAFLARSAEPEARFGDLPCIRLDKGAHLLIDDNRLSQSPRVFYDSLKSDAHVNPIAVIESNDLDGSLDWVRSKGAVVAGGIEERLGARFFVFRDPDGNEFIVCGK